MFKTWTEINYKNPENITEVLEQPLWDNDLMQIAHKTIRNKIWRQSGML